MEKSFRGQKHVCSNCNTKFFDFNKEKIICPNCKTEKIIQKKAPISSVDFKTEKEVETVDDNLELSEEVEFDDDELNEVLENDTISRKRVNCKLFFIGAVAQLGERVNGIHEVRGSIPLGSTIFLLYKINIIML